MTRSVALLLYEIDTLAGMQRQGALLAARLSARGWDVRIVSTVGPRNFVSLLGKPVRGVEETPVIRIPISRSPIFEIAAQSWLARQGGVDVMLAIGWHSAVHGVKIAAMSGVPVVARYGASGTHGDFSQLAQSPAARKALDAVSRHICLSRDIREEVLAAGLLGDRVVVIPNGVDVGIWRGDREPLPTLGEGPVILFAGRLCRQKRVDVLLEAFALVAREAPRARLVIAGAGPLETDLRALASRLELTERTVFLGACRDMPALYSSASLLVLPSESEGMPNVVLEALASGTPVVATELPGTAEIARDEIEALLVAPGDHGALAKAMARVLNDAELARRLAQAGHSRVCDAFDIERIADEYSTLLAEVATEAK